MSYVMLYELFPDLAMKETRTITVFTNNKYELPSGDYGLIEMYCNDEDCDCRRVFLNVISSATNDSFAVIAYGWESMSYYAEWYFGYKTDITKLRGPDQRTVMSLKGPCLNDASPQSQFAPVLLKMVNDLVLTDRLYVDRLKRHYTLFRAKVDENYRNYQNYRSK